ncbi:MAG: translation initiation factor IF-2 [Nanoarchaeota archaeon]
MAIRSPICTVVGHVDHGKSSVLDWIRGSNIVATEPGAITQSIGASNIPLEIIKQKCGVLLEKVRINFTIPGLLFIDTPGHAAFTNLRKRGGNLADIAIVVVDINEGFKPQTIEAIEILKSYKTPFIIAANKIDLINGWTQKEKLVLQNIELQNDYVKQFFEEKLYTLVRSLYDVGKMDGERFDRVTDYTKQVAIVPCSTRTGEGLPELLMSLIGMAQKYLEKNLEIKSEEAKAIVLEVKEAKGLGKALDVILYDGILKSGDNIVIGGLEKPIVTKVKALFVPQKMGELRYEKTKFDSVKEVIAASAIRISANDIETVVSGVPLVSAKNIEAAKEEVQKEIEEVTLHTDPNGVVIKADSLGSLEALMFLLREKKIPVGSASIGNITRKDLATAETQHAKDPLYGIILGFNVNSDVSNPKIKILTNNIIYKLIEDFESWKIDLEKNIEQKALEGLVRPCKIQLLKNYIFRQSSPAVLGVEVLAGKLKAGMPLMDKNGKQITTVKALQVEKESVSELEENKQGAVSLDHVVIGRTLVGDEILYSSIPANDFKKMKEFKRALSSREVETIKEIAIIMRKENPVWGI